MPCSYKLVKLGNGGVTLELDGVRMHQSARKTPFEDAVDKARLVGCGRGSVVLDVCTGLGYSAIACVDAGASKVVTVERDLLVLGKAFDNPASKRLFDNPLIDVVRQDALEVLPTLDGSAFDCVLHDPPRFSLAGGLYSAAFYRELFCVLKPGGRLFHYVGSPGLKRGRNIAKGVKQRLQEAGFAGVKWVESCLGFTAFKSPAGRRPRLGLKHVF